MERNSGTATFLSVLYLISVALLCVQLARLASNVWVGVLVFGGFMAIHIALNLALAEEFGGIFWLAWGGAWAIAYAGMLAEYAGRWIWVIPWALAGILYLSIGGAAAGKSKWVANATVFLGIWALAWAVVSPLWLYGKDQEEAREWTLDLLRDWWWVPVAFIGGLLVIGLLALLWSWMSDRRKVRKRTQRSTPRTIPRPRPEARPRPQPGLTSRPATKPKPKPKPSEPDPKPPRHRAPAGPVVIGAAGAVKKKPLLGSAEPRKKPPIDDDSRTLYVPEDAAGTGTMHADAGLAGESLYTVPFPLVDLLAVAGAHLLLTEDGRLSRWHAGSLDDVPGVLLDRPAGLGAGGDVVVAADRDKRLVALEYSDGAAPQVSTHRLKYTVGAFAVNPFGTIVAYSPAQRGSVFAVLLASGQTQLLSDDVGSTSAMAFSADGRLLALGGKDGFVRLFDMSTRRVEKALQPPPAEGGKVISLAECPERGWVAGYASGRVVHWDASDEVDSVVRESHHVSTLAVAAQSGKVAVGCDDGHVVVHPIGSDAALFDGALAADRVVGLVFENDGGAVVIASHDGSVRRAGV